MHESKKIAVMFENGEMALIDENELSKLRYAGTWDGYHHFVCPECHEGIKAPDSLPVELHKAILDGHPCLCRIKNNTKNT